MRTSSRIAMALLLCSAPALAVKTAPASENTLVLQSTLGNVSSAPRTIPDVKPGATFNITGDCIAQANPDADVRVVFSLADDDGGYRAILATEQKRDGRMLQVRAPDLPEIANQTVQVQLFLIGYDAPVVCQAGAIRIG